MQVKRFFAENMRTALKMVREELGPDAVILSSKRFDNGVEVLTTISGDANPHGDSMESRAANDNPFKVDAEQSAGAGKKPSRLEMELEQMQRMNQQRARELADSMAKRSPAAKPVPAEERAPAAPKPASPRRSAQPHTDSHLPEPQADVVSLRGAPAGATESTASVEGEVAQLRDELRSMRDMLEQQLSSLAWGSYRQQHPRQASLWRRMKRMGLSASIAHGLLETLKDEKTGDEKLHWQMLMARLVNQLPVDGSDMVAGGGVFVMVGPTGAGKTTTIGKLATRYVLEHGAESVALVTTDTARIAAYEQLRTFGRILNVPVKVVDRHTSLERVLFALRHKSLVLVDTAGFSRQDPKVAEQMRVLNELSDQVKTLLTLPATCQKPVIKATYHAFRDAHLAGCILTKLDEASSIGEVLSLAVEKRLPIAYSTDGQNIPNDIQVASAKALVTRAIGLAKTVVTGDAAMADEVSVLAQG